MNTLFDQYSLMKNVNPPYLIPIYCEPTPTADGGGLYAKGMSAVGTPSNIHTHKLVVFVGGAFSASFRWRLILMYLLWLFWGFLRKVIMRNSSKDG